MTEQDITKLFPAQIRKALGQALFAEIRFMKFDCG